MISPVKVDLTYFKRIAEAIEMSLVALGDTEAILRRGHWGKNDRKEALAELRAVREVIEEIKKDHKG